MAINESIVINRKWRKCIDIVNKTWQRISFWTHSSDVEFTDGKTAETKVGAIDGITDSLVSTSSRIAASAKAVNTLSNELNGCSFEQDGEDFYIVGADSVRKKLGSGTIHTFIGTNTSLNANETSDVNNGVTFDLSKVYKDYKKLTINNIAGGIYKSTAGSTANLTRTGTVTFDKITSYSPGTGIIKANIKSKASSGSVTISATPIFYIFD